MKDVEYAELEIKLWNLERRIESVERDTVNLTRGQSATLGSVYALGEISGTYTAGIGYKDVDLTGFHMDSEEFVAQVDGVDTFKVDASTGTITIGEGNVIDGSCISVPNLSAISADLGTITAGTVTGGTVRTAASGARVVMDVTGVKWYDATTQRGQILNDGSGWLGASGSFSWTTAGVVSIDGARINNASVTYDKLNVATLSAISANIGTITAGSISGITASFGGGDVTADTNGICLVAKTSQHDTATLRWVVGNTTFTRMFGLYAGSSPNRSGQVFISAAGEGTGASAGYVQIFGGTTTLWVGPSSVSTDSSFQCNTINEYISAAGVTVESVLVKDGAVQLTGTGAAGRLSFNDTATQVWVGTDGQLRFKDATSGTKTLAELAA